MELEKVREVHEAKDSMSCNDYLSVGWVLLAVATMNTDSKEWSGPQIKYSLGWIKDGEPIYPNHNI